MTSAAPPSASPRPPSASPRPPSPAPHRLRLPGWLDLRLVLGVALVLASVALGAKVLASSDNRDAFWGATRDLAPGTVITESDIVVLRVQLGDGSAYVPAAEEVVGKAIARAIGDGEMLPRAGLGDPVGATTVTIPVDTNESPAVQRGQRITVWVSTASCRAVVVLPDVAVQAVAAPRAGGLSAGARTALTVRLSPQLAARVVLALDLPSAVIRVGVLSGVPGASGELSDLAACEPTR